MACKCKDCEICEGRRYFYRNIDGSLSRYHTDDLQQFEDCDQCDGTGWSEMCEECMENYYNESL